MSGVKAVAAALTALRKTAHAAKFAQAGKILPASRQKLVGVGLMSNIPDHLVLRQIKHQMHRHGKLHHTEVRCQMTSVFTDRPDQKLPNLIRKQGQFLFIQFFYVIWLIHLL